MLKVKKEQERRNIGNKYDPPFLFFIPPDKIQLKPSVVIISEILMVFFFCSGNGRAAVLFGSTWHMLQAAPRIKLEDLYNFSQHGPSRGEASSPSSDLEKQHSWASGRLHTTMSMSTACRPALAAGGNRGAACSQQHILSERWAGSSDPAQAPQLPAKAALSEHDAAAFLHGDKHTGNWHYLMTQQRAKSGQPNRATHSYGSKGVNSGELTQDVLALLS